MSKCNSESRKAVRIASCLVSFVALWSWMAASGRALAQSSDDSLSSAPSNASNEAMEFFEKKVRPLLIEHCLECHSTNTEQSGGLLLDSKAGWSVGGDSGPAIDPTDWQKSLLWVAVEYQNPHLQMPPDGKLSKESLEILKQWLSTGAFDPREAVVQAKQPSRLAVADAQQHWAYRPLSSPAVPRHLNPEPSKNSVNANAVNSIDAFLNQQQSLFSIVPNPPANPQLVYQRLLLDLHGLRCADDSVADGFSEKEAWDEASYSELVDSMLASPRFGERFARRWMDVVRYADSLTLRGFVLPDAWRYRNYLIEVWNQDLPIDDFIRQQIAGDLMSSESISERQRQWIATTALALGDTNLEEQDKKQLEMDYVDEQLDMIGKAFLAQTIGCARCHDHKFDPIPTSDYYAMAGILRSSDAMKHANVSEWIRLPLPLESSATEHYQSLQTQIAACEKELAQLKLQLQSHTKESLVQSVTSLDGIVVDDLQAKKIGAWESSSVVKAYVGYGYVHDRNESKGEKSLVFEPTNILPGTYLVRMSYSHGTNRSRATVVRIFSADGEDMVKVNQTDKPKDDGLWVTLGTYRFEQGGQAFVIVSNEGSDGHVIGDAIQFLPEESARAVAAANANSDSKHERVDSSEEETVRKAVQACEVTLKQLQEAYASRPMVLTIRANDQAKDLPIHIRGNVHQLGPVVPRGFLSCVEPVVHTPSALDASSNGRLELAHWLTRPDHPLTARVYVNRVWSWMMGQGMVRTIDNFGTTGEAPSHPELLDWLTQEFIRHNWSTKWLVREIVLSQAYRRGSQRTQHLEEADPDNRTFARASLRRLDAEALRDSLLQMSGELEWTTPASTVPPNTKEDYRFEHPVRYRSIYGPWFRNSPPELFSEFDGANSSFSISTRNRSTVAPQALALLNSRWVRSRAERFGAWMAHHPGTLSEKLELSFKKILGRSPRSQEIAWFQANFANRIQPTKESEIWTDLAHDLIASIDFRFIK